MNISLKQTILLFVLFTFLLFCYSYPQNDFDVINLKFKNSSNINEKTIEFVAFGEKIVLNLERNNKLLGEYFKIFNHNGPEIINKKYNFNESCNYLHQDESITAAISLCNNNGAEGLIIFKEITFEITPLNKLQFQRNNYRNIRSLTKNEEILHVVKRFRIGKLPTFSPFSQQLQVKAINNNNNNNNNNNDTKSLNNKKNELTIELAVFFDEAGYKLFSPFLDNDDKKLNNMLLAYINQIQALYYHPSLGIKINIVLVRLDIMKQQPVNLPHYNGERLQLLNAFCDYNSEINPLDDSDPNHWDIGLYLSGLDFYTMENGVKNGLTMGLATVSGVCLHKYSCVIAELGVSNPIGRPYPSAGFTSVYIAAHEIGHNLGMHHDSYGNLCSENGYIMSPSRGTRGETVWSSCSREIAIELFINKPCLLDKNIEKLYDNKNNINLDHRKYLTLPGRVWSAKKQCEFLLRDKNADVVTLTNACVELKCKSYNRDDDYYFAGPALDGTICDDGKECRGGQCLNSLYFINNNTINIIDNDDDDWSSWKGTNCTSSCIYKSKGFINRDRFCIKKNGKCKGSSSDVKLCNDKQICKKRKRITVEKYATMKCNEFSVYLPEIDDSSIGLQIPHEINKPSMACSIFCRRKDIASYYTPRVELNDLNINPYFPDGTWCHKENKQNYYCLKNHCLPDNFTFFKNTLESDNVDDDNNYYNKISKTLIDYLNLEINDSPLLKSISNNFTNLNYDEWMDNDYIQLPEN